MTGGRWHGQVAEEVVRLELRGKECSVLNPLKNGFSRRATLSRFPCC